MSTSESRRTHIFTKRSDKQEIYCEQERPFQMESEAA